MNDADALETVMLVEARRARRVRTILAGRIYAEPDRVEKCTIRSLSPLGAKLQLNTSAPLPENFELEVMRWGQRYKVRQVWSEWLQVGVEFHEPLQVSSATDTKLTLLAELDAAYKVKATA